MERTLSAFHSYYNGYGEGQMRSKTTEGGASGEVGYACLQRQRGYRPAVAADRPSRLDQRQRRPERQPEHPDGLPGV
jgi:hypothetical protein